MLRKIYRVGVTTVASTDKNESNILNVNETRNPLQMKIKARKRRQGKTPR